MKPLSKTSSMLRLATLLSWGLFCFVLQACHGNIRTQSAVVYTLPPARTAGDWRSPRDPEERRRLDAHLKDQFVSFQDCVWRYAGFELGGGGKQLPMAPLIGTIGVGRSGKVEWLEITPDSPSLYSLRECLSERLSRLEFVPPPAQPVLLVLTLPQIKGRRLAGVVPFVPWSRPRPGSTSSFRAG